MKKTFLFAVCAFFAAAPLSAGIIYSNLAASYPAGAPNEVYSLGSFGVIATTFNATSGGKLESILLSASSNLSLTTISLYTNSGNAPNTILESWSVALPAIGINPPPLTTLTSALQPMLFTGSQYWLVLTMPSSGPFIQLGMNNSGILGGEWTGLSPSSMSNFFPDKVTPAIMVNTIAPEPASLGLVGAAALFGLWRWRKLWAESRV